MAGFDYLGGARDLVFMAQPKKNLMNSSIFLFLHPF
jgi:hypothetical protein